MPDDRPHQRWRDDAQEGLPDNQPQYEDYGEEPLKDGDDDKLEQNKPAPSVETKRDRVESNQEVDDISKGEKGWRPDK